ncbi:MAG TPA: penicillin-binding transpeptidase domain-containing protein [Actinomycetota bacterium]|nr:penicillin-binding transpeptidase domain-containing protein [Actinomycetota bacterium]
MHAQIRKVGIGLCIAFTAVFVQLNYVQIFAAERIAENNANPRALLQQYSIKRGDILTLDGERVAVSEDTGGKLRYRRTYPGGELYGHITGYYSITYGSSRIEASFNDALLGDSGVITMQDIEDRLFGRKQDQGDDVRLTVHSRLQEVARTALGSNRGAVVALDPSNGEVRAMWSNPSYDPTQLASFESKEATSHWRSLSPKSSKSPLISIATSGGYPPGSTFKTVTASAALESGEYTPRSTFPDPERLEPCSKTEGDEPCMPLTTKSLTNFSNTACVGGGQIDLFLALQVSCDTTFAIIGLEIPDEIRETSEAFGFNSEIEFDVGNEPSRFPDIEDEDAPLRAYAGIGQGDVVATPLQMALVAAGIANGGEVPRPRLVREIISPSGSIVRSFGPETLSEAVSATTADTVTEMMVAAVEDGTGTAAQIPGVEVAGKTGTAQTVEGADPHTWFISFAPADDPKLVVAVLVENGGTLGSEATGGAVAAPIAKALLDMDRSIRGW